MNLFEYNRIIILGNNGSGKSYLAKELAAIMGLPLIHLDAEFWLPNWGMPSKEEWLKRNIEFISKEKWIIDGMCSHGGTMDLRFEAADFIIFLDINPLICLAGVMKRNGKKRPDTALNRYHCDEKFDKRFIKFCKGILHFNKTVKTSIIDLHKKYPEKPFFVINRKTARGRFLRFILNNKIEPNRTLKSIKNHPKVPSIRKQLKVGSHALPWKYFNILPACFHQNHINDI